MKIVGYLRASTDLPDMNKQKVMLQDYASKQRIQIDEFVEIQMPSFSKTAKYQVEIETFLEKLHGEDTLLVSALSQLGNNLSQIVFIVDRLIQKKVHFIAIKESIRLDGGQNTRTKIITAIFSLLAEIERALITRHMLTKDGTQGKTIGRPKGAWGKSRLDGREEEIKVLLRKKVSKSSIAKIMDVSRTALYHFVVSRKLV